MRFFSFLSLDGAGRGLPGRSAHQGCRHDTVFHWTSPASRWAGARNSGNLSGQVNHALELRQLGLAHTLWALAHRVWRGKIVRIRCAVVVVTFRLPFPTGRSKAAAGQGPVRRFGQERSRNGPGRTKTALHEARGAIKNPGLRTLFPRGRFAARWPLFSCGRNIAPPPAEGDLVVRLKIDRTFTALHASFSPGARCSRRWV